MTEFRFSEALLNSIPAHYWGRWRVSADGFYNENGKVKKHCIRAPGDIFED